VAVELTLSIDGDEPHPVVAILEFRDASVVRERIYIAEPWNRPPTGPHGSTAASQLSGAVTTEAINQWCDVAGVRPNPWVLIGA
jgi:hypothetical protein